MLHPPPERRNSGSHTHAVHTHAVSTGRTGDTYTNLGKGEEGEQLTAMGIEDEDLMEQEYEPLPANVYGWAISMVVRDFIWLSQGTHLRTARVARIMNSVMVIFCTIAMQVFLLFAVSRLLCEKQVNKIRRVYGDYEFEMYGNNTFTTVNGFDRGIRGYRKDENFLLMDKDFLRELCEVPLAHPWYLACILVIWAFTCQVELRTIFETSYRLSYATPTVSSLSQVLKTSDDDKEAHIVQGLTVFLKVFIAVFVQLPRIVTLLALIWLGCRWLTATIGLDDVLLNGLALEFMVLLKELFYNVCISHRNKVETERLLIKPFRDLNEAGYVTFFDAQVWGLISVFFVWVYVFYLQQVLPDYNWDVNDLCTLHHEVLSHASGSSARHHGSHGLHLRR